MSSVHEALYDGEWRENTMHGNGKYAYDNGNSYDGEISQGKKHGKGKFVWTDGRVYEGGFREDQIDGSGKMVFPSGASLATYEGEFKEERFHGSGNLLWIDGRLYEGEFIKGKKHGKGTLSRPCGKTYYGEWREDKMHGSGKMVYSNGKTYDGEWRGDKKHGSGKWIFTDGQMYEGDFDRGKLHGKGKYLWPSGQSYDGDFEEGKITGSGTMVISNGNMYEGEWRDGTPHGCGRGIESTGDSTISYNGEWREGKEHGRGKRVYSVGFNYEGEFSEGTMHGVGKITFSGGDTYIGEMRESIRSGRGAAVDQKVGKYDGEWSKDKKNGRGKMVYSCGCTYDGEWREGKRNGSGKMVFSNGETYDGEWRGDKEHGRGNKVLTDGQMYEGEFGEGKMHGRGKCSWHNHHSYDGEWFEGKRCGWGKMVYPGGLNYDGAWSEDVRSGWGKMVHSDGDTYDGEWREDKRNGRGVQTQGVDGKVTGSKHEGDAGDKYDGEWKDNWRHGASTYTFFNGETFSCTWAGGCCFEFITRQRAVRAASDHVSAQARAEDIAPIVPLTDERARSLYKANSRPELTCTQRCRRNSNGEYCPFFASGNCWFAHSEEELRCVLYARDGLCPFGDSCGRAHVTIAAYNPNEIRSWGRPPPQASVAYIRRLGTFPFPKNYSHFVPSNKDSIRVCRSDAVTHLTKVALMLPPIDHRATRSSIIKRLSTLQFFEELFNTIDILAYQLSGVKIRLHNGFARHHDMFDIDAPGLSENRPSVLRGDNIHVRLQGQDQMFGGKVHFVYVESVTVALPLDFVSLWSSTSLCDVVFTISRTQHRVRHEAICNAPFPSSAWCLARVSPAVVEPRCAAKHPRLLNAKQRQVLALVTSGARASILWGPPGTGKTTALVAAIAETCFSNPQCRLLICAPSNEAADLIVDRLHAGYAEVCSSLLRLNGVSRAEKNVSSKSALRHSLPDGSGGFKFPDLKQLLGYRLVVCTLMTSGKLVAVGVSDKHFTHLFVDEAGHTTEADLMVALQSVPNVKHMMLAGDHKQLGAVVRAPPSIAAGMHLSPLERLQNDPLMKDQVVMLTDNYRSHPAIVNIVNVIYNDKLVAAAAADPVFRHPSLKLCVRHGCSVQLNVSNACPVVFLHHKSPETREADSPSWCNVNEAHMLISVAFDLHDRHGVSFSDIAIISPYRKQVLKISGILHAHSERSPGVKRINVSTVELFQGRESRVVLLSCVRNCSVENVETDVQFSIGFLKQPLRANVALSRAKSLLVIAGNAGLMGFCKTWRTYLERIIALPQPCMFDVTCSLVQELHSIPKQDMRCERLVAALDAIESAQEERPFDRVE